MDGFDAALARYRAFLAHDPITPLLRRSLALLVPGNIRVDTVTADDSLRCTTDGTAVTVGGAEYLLRTDFEARHWTAALRVLLARALCAAGELLILDEPVTGLDPAAAQDLYRTLAYLNETEGIAIVMVTHDLQSALQYADTVLYAGQGKWFHGTTAEYLASPYGRRFGGERT